MVDGFESTLDASPSSERRLKDASPEGTDLVARMARAGIESRLFGGGPGPVQVGRYSIVRELGMGGMGVVYRARDPELDRDVALKLLHPNPGHVSDLETARERLVREARAMARLSHPNVLAVHEVGTFEDQIYVAMEYVDGRTLSQWLEGEQRPWTEILDVFLEAGRGLAAAHDEGIVHRDFKPENVMVSDKGRVQVLDFGLARSIQEAEEAADVGLSSSSTEQARATTMAVAEKDGTLTRTGAMVGTPAYMAPEQYSGTGATMHSDQFAYCVALWEAMYGKRPFAGKTVAALADSVTSGKIQATPLDRERPPWIRRVLERGLAVDPNDRWPSMNELLDALTAGSRREELRRRRIPLIVGAVVLVLGGAITAIAIVPKDPPEVIEVRSPPEIKEVGVLMPSVPNPPPAPAAAAGSSTGNAGTGSSDTGQAVAEKPHRAPVRREPKYTHAWCFYHEDTKEAIGQGRKRFASSLQTGNKCWICVKQSKSDAARIRQVVSQTDCARYASCRNTPCEDSG